MGVASNGAMFSDDPKVKNAATEMYYKLIPKNSHYIICHLADIYPPIS